MPVQIKNLLIVANITEDSGKKKPENKGSSNLNEEAKMQIVEETVQQVLEILERQKDR